MRVIHDQAPAGDATAMPLLVVCLPGAGDRARDFFTHGFVAALREHVPHADVAAVDTRMEDYLAHEVTAQLATKVIAPARLRYGRNIWLLGISLGGLGALLYAAQHERDVRGLLLFAPYLGARGLIVDIMREGGLPALDVASAQLDAHEQALFGWLRSYNPADERRAALYLGCGRDDRFALASELLAACVEPARRIRVPGGHDWPTWLALWKEMLASRPFAIGAPSRAIQLA